MLLKEMARTQYLRPFSLVPAPCRNMCVLQLSPSHLTFSSLILQSCVPLTLASPTYSSATKDCCSPYPSCCCR